MERPEGMFSTIIWVLSLPVYVPLYFTLSRPQFGGRLARVLKQTSEPPGQ